MPLAEQRLIAKFIESATNALDTSLARTEREIALMQEYRTRLTADLVTGKLDVREAAAKLPNVQSDRSDPSDQSDYLSDLSDESDPAEETTLEEES